MHRRRFRLIIGILLIVGIMEYLILEGILPSPLKHLPVPIRSYDFIPDDLVMSRDDLFERKIMTNGTKKYIRILCWILTAPRYLKSRAIHVKRTWAKRCDISLFFSSTTDNFIPTIGLNVSEGKSHLAAKVMRAFRYIYHNYKDKADWILGADDDTYVIVENLKYFLKRYNASKPLLLGEYLTNSNKRHFIDGGGGLVLSSEALKKLSTLGKNPQVCRQDGPAGDLAVSECMDKIGVEIINATDITGKSLFHHFIPEAYLFGNFPNWYYVKGNPHQGMDFISKHPISFHYVPPAKMYLLDFSIYHLKVAGEMAIL